MLTLSYFLILFSAIIHASWNALAKRIDGNLPDLVMAEFVGSLILFPFVFIHDNPWESLHEKESWYYLLGSISMHSSYVVLLSNAYAHGTDFNILYCFVKILFNQCMIVQIDSTLYTSQEILG
jgi:hypothetical protein